MDHVSLPFFVEHLFTRVHIFQMCRQDKMEVSPPITTFLEFFGEMQSADPDAPLDPPPQWECYVLTTC